MNLIVSILLGLLAASDIYVVRGNSMLPALRDGDHVVLEKSAHYAQGDIVGFQFKTRSMPMIKRVVALGGETVAYVDGRLLVDGKPYTVPGQAKPYDITHQHARKLLVQIERHGGRVPPGALLVLGDNPAASNDSAAFGFVFRDQLIGKAVPVLSLR